MTVHQAKRVIVGHCPSCFDPIVVLNNHEVWPVVECGFGWAGSTTEIKNHTRLTPDGGWIRRMNAVVRR